MRFLKTGLASAFFGLLLVTTTMADERKLIDQKSPDSEPTTDKEFLIRAISCEVAEVKFAEAAEKNAHHEDVRKLAGVIARDHKKIRDDLLEQAKKMKVAVVEGLEKSHRDQYDRMSKLDGAAYDREYLRWLTEGHEKTNKLYKKWGKDATDADLRTSVTNATTKMQDHVAQVKKVKEKLKDSN